METTRQPASTADAHPEPLTRYHRYRGRVGPDGWPGRVTVETLDLSEPLDPRHDLRNHSPDGFSWGYHGSGPAQLALAILADQTGDDDLALKLYQRFKLEVVATWPQDAPWEINGADVEAWVDRAVAR